MSKLIENRYLVKPEEGIVVCRRMVTEEGMDLITEETDKRCSHDIAMIIRYLNWWNVGKVVSIPIEIAKEFKGVAKCDQRDTFDEKVGKDVARLIAKKKYHAAAANRYTKLAEFFKRAMEEMITLSFEHNKSFSETEAQLDKYKVN